MADELKAKGNAAISAKNFDEAVKYFTEAIGLQPKNHILYSNRSAAYASKKDYENAVKDAKKTTELEPTWAKGFGRLGTAMHGLGDLLGANDAFEAGLKLDPNNAQNKSGLAAVKRAIEAEAREDGVTGNPMDGGLGSMFNDPQLIQKLAANPKTSKLLGDPSFMQKLQYMQKNPNDTAAMFQDQRMISVLGALMGIDMEGMAGGPGSAAAAAAAATGGDKKSGVESDDDEDVDMPDLISPRAQTAKSTETKKAPEPEPEPEDTDAAEKIKAKVEAEKEKALGTDNYKKRNFDGAISHYTKAWELHKDITYLNNLGTANFEKGDYEETIRVCEEAVEKGREIYADFKMIAKAYARIGSAYEKVGDPDKAIINYKSALTEHRTPEIVKKLRTCENKKIEDARQAYINPEKAEEARKLGNDKFKEADWPAAVEAYSEMAKRAPDDPRGYSNRAAAFIKLLEFPSAIIDCDLAIKKDPSFVRAYLRKAQAYFGMRDYSKCIDTCEEASKHDKDKTSAREIEQQQQKALQAMYSGRENETEEQTKERIQKDPEIMSIMGDPVMQSILQQAQGDPAALQEHMRNPGIKKKVERLIAAGVIRVGR